MLLARTRRVQRGSDPSPPPVRRDWVGCARGLTPPPAAHAPSVCGVGRRCDGSRAPLRQPRGRLSSGPGRPGLACLEASCEAPWDPARGPRGCLAAPACGDLCPGRLLWLPAPPSCPERSDRTLSHLRRSAIPRHCCRFAANGPSGPPGSRPSNTRTYLPGAGRCHVGCWYRTPRRGQRPGHLNTPRDSGDKSRRAHCDGMVNCAMQRGQTPRHQRCEED